MDVLSAPIPSSPVIQAGENHSPIQIIPGIHLSGCPPEATRPKTMFLCRVYTSDTK